MREFLTLKKLRYLYGYAIKSVRLRITIFTSVIGSPFAIFTVIAGLFPNSNPFEKLCFTLYIFLIEVILFICFIYIRSTDILVVESKANKERALENHAYLQKLDSKFYGVSRLSYNVRGEIKEDGSNDSTNEITLKATTDRIYSVEHLVIIPHVPKEINEEISFCTTSSDDGKIVLKPVVVTHGKHRLFWKLNFLPVLPKDKVINYSFKNQAPKGSFAMTYEEMKERDIQYEYWAVRIAYPTENFNFRVVFPKDFDLIDYDYDVWLGEGRVQHIDEYFRIHSSKFWNTGREHDGRMFIELSNVITPIHGLIYVLKWSPGNKKVDKDNIS